MTLCPSLRQSAFVSSKEWPHPSRDRCGLRSRQTVSGQLLFDMFSICFCILERLNEVPVPRVDDDVNLLVEKVACDVVYLHGRPGEVGV
jgi:hypothetical protein